MGLDRDRIRPDRPGRRAGERRRPVAVIGEADAEGSAPDFDSAAAGKPLVVTVKVPGLPAVNVEPPTLVIAGAWSTVSVKLWVASGETPLDALNVIG